jgi:hypothetical protein
MQIQIPSKVIAKRLMVGADKERSGKRCWVWRGYTKNGYGAMSVSDRMVYAHRLSFQMHHGPIPLGKEVCHTCDNPRCIRPSHLFAGTRKQNVHDAITKGRASKPPRIIGLRQHKATLTPSQCADIRRLIQTCVPQRAVAAQFHCSKSTAWRIGNRKTRAEA